MKMRNLLLTIAGLILLNTQFFAQNVDVSTSTLNYQTPGPDYVTAGSVTPYAVIPDATIEAMSKTTPATMKQSVFEWKVVDPGSNPVTGLFKKVSTPADAAVEYDEYRKTTTPSGYYDNQVAVSWPTTQGNYVISTTERSVTLSDKIMGCLSATTETKNVFVLAPPTVGIRGTDTEIGGCLGAGVTTVNIPISLSGLGKWKVSYKYTYNGGATETEKNDIDITLATPAFTDANTYAEVKTLNDASRDANIVFDVPAGQYGFYDIVLTDVTDFTSRKSLVDVAGNLGTTKTIRVYVNPTPTTQPIQHIKNL